MIKRLSFLACLTLIMSSGLLASTVSSEPSVKPLWLRDVRISPDGSTIAFCYKGDIWSVSSSGGIANDISKRFGVSPQKTASLLDTFSCFVQGLIPYGAQVLMAAGLCGISPTSIIPLLYYPVIMGAFAILSILFDYPRPLGKR